VTDGETTYFSVEVIPEDNRPPWRVMRRYCHFRSLSEIPARRSDESMYYQYYRARLHHFGSLEPSFPRKHLRACNGTRLEARRSGLESWLNSKLQQATVLTPTWSRFLLAGRFPVPAQISTSPHASELTVATPSDELVPIYVDIPKGVKHGELLSVVTPNGETITISVPWSAPSSESHIHGDLKNTSSSDSLKLWHDRIGGTLGVQHVYSLCPSSVSGTGSTLSTSCGLISESMRSTSGDS